jgi:hypothetical protein
MIRRREVITLLGGAAAAWPLASRAQEATRVYTLGAIIPVGRNTPAIEAFFDEMRLFGFIEGKNLAVLPNGFGVRNDELAERAKALVDAAPDVIISGPDNYTRVLQQATHTIPLVAMTEDMLRAGFVGSLARPSLSTESSSAIERRILGYETAYAVDEISMPPVDRVACERSICIERRRGRKRARTGSGLSISPSVTLRAPVGTSTSHARGLH